MKIASLTLGIVLLWAGTPAAREEGPAPTIVIRPKIGPEERARLDAEERRRWERLRREVAAWRRRFDPAVAPVRRAAGEALRSLRITWGPYSRNLGYEVVEEVSKFRRADVLPAPDPELDAQLRRALAELEQGGDFCLRGMPTRAQLRLEQGLRRIDQALEPFAPGAPPRPGGVVRLKAAARQP
jgi:hypothetical protein